MSAPAGGDDRGEDHPGEEHRGSVLARLTWLRAGVLGANDGIVSTAGLVVGVAGATTSTGPVLLAGAAGVVAGALSMGGGEYVSVSTQRDTEHALLARERWELEHLPEEELAELAALYADRGLPPHLADQVARALTAHDALGAHAAVELGIDPHERSDPWRAAWSSMAAFAVGALLPLLAIALPPLAYRVPVTAAAVVLALALTGWVSARLGGAPALPAVLRTVGVGAAAMLVTWTAGALVGARLL